MKEREKFLSEQDKKREKELRDSFSNYKKIDFN